MAVMYGPIQMIAIGFDNAKTKSKAKKALLELSKQGMIRIIDISYVSRSVQDNVTVIKGTELDEIQKVTLGAAIGGLIGMGMGGQEGMEKGVEAGAMRYSERDFGASPDDLRAFAENLPKGSSVAIILFEHLWLKNLKDEVTQSGGRLLAQTFITPQSLAQLGVNIESLAQAIETEKILESNSN